MVDSKSFVVWIAIVGIAICNDVGLFDLCLHMKAVNVQFWLLLNDDDHILCIF